MGKEKTKTKEEVNAFYAELVEEQKNAEKAVAQLGPAKERLKQLEAELEKTRDAIGKEDKRLVQAHDELTEVRNALKEEQRQFVDGQGKVAKVKRARERLEQRAAEEKAKTEAAEKEVAAFKERYDAAAQEATRPPRRIWVNICSSELIPLEMYWFRSRKDAKADCIECIHIHESETLPKLRNCSQAVMYELPPRVKPPEPSKAPGKKRESKPLSKQP